MCGAVDLRANELRSTCLERRNRSTTHRHTHTHKSHVMSKREGSEGCEFTEYLVSLYNVPVIGVNAEIQNQINQILLTSHPEGTAALESHLDL